MQRSRALFVELLEHLRVARPRVPVHSTIFALEPGPENCRTRLA